MSLPQVDHIIYLLSSSQLKSLPPIFSSNFNVLPGGRHTDGASENKLIVLGDGVYLELIAFLDEEKRKTHWWGSRPEGSVIDFAYTLPEKPTAIGNDESGPETSNDSTKADIEAETTSFTSIQTAVAKVSQTVHYDNPVAGSRQKPTGEVIKWKVAFPAAVPGQPPLIRGEVPFWCFDETPRSLRVPHHAEENIQHPCGAVGVAYICVMVPPSRLQDLLPVYDKIHGMAGQWVTEDKKYGISGAYYWQLDVPASSTKVDIILKALEGDSTKESAAKIKIGLWKATDENGLKVFELE